MTNCSQRPGDVSRPEVKCGVCLFHMPSRGELAPFNPLSLRTSRLCPTFRSLLVVPHPLSSSRRGWQLPPGSKYFHSTCLTIPYKFGVCPSFLSA